MCVCVVKNKEQFPKTGAERTADRTGWTREIHEVECEMNNKLYQ